jgi:hypothetical protein
MRKKSQRPRGRPPLFGEPMTAAERMRRCRAAKRKKERPAPDQRIIVHHYHGHCPVCGYKGDQP